MRYLQGLLIITIIVFASCGNEQVKETKKEKTATADSFSVMTISTHHLGSKVQLPGVIEPFEFVQIFPKVGGFVKSVLVDRGSRVKKGALLLVLDAPEQTEHLAAAKLKYTEGVSVLQNSTDRYKRLLETSKTPGTVSPYDLAAAESKMKADEAMVQGAQANYKAQQAMVGYLTVTAPFDGVITERNVHPGALVGPGAQSVKPMLVLQQQNKFRLVVSIPEQTSSQIKDGDELSYTITALPGQQFKGRISRSSGALSDKFRSETVEIDVPNDNNVIKAGMHAELAIPVSGNTHAFVLPKSAIVTTTERKYVVALSDGKAKYVDVTTGNQASDSTEVFGSLNDGDNIICNATYEIKEGQIIENGH